MKETQADTVDFSPCQSSNRRYLNNTKQLEEDVPLRFVSISERKIKNHNTEVTLASHDRPASPSPICSPVSFITCSSPTEFYYSQLSTDFSQEPSTTRNQSSYMVNEDGKSPSSVEEVKENKKKEEINEDQKSLNHTQLQNHKAKSVRKIRQSFNDEVYEIKELVQEIPMLDVNGGKGKNGCGTNLGLSTISQEIFLSPDTGESSETESAVILSSIRSSKKSSHVLMEDLRLKNLMAWKELETSKLMNKLRRKEAAITEWELEEKTTARTQMKNTERELEKEREKAMEKMKRKIWKAQKKADDMKLRETVVTLVKVSKVSEMVEKKRVNGKLSWKVLCF